MKWLVGLTRPELAAELAALGEPRYRTDQVLRWLYRRRAGTVAEITDVPAALRERLAAGFGLGLPEPVRATGAAGGTRKFLLRLADGNLIETVLIPASAGADGAVAERRTLCVSTQVGCAYGCRFCASGLDGFKRDLTAGEMVGQLLAVERVTGERVGNLVFMGMGEPLANMAGLLRAIELFNSPWGIGLGARHLTVSTSGLVPGIRRLADDPRQVRLAVSLHAATDDLRGRLMPVNRKYNLAALLEACAYYARRKKQRITFEYLLLAGVNDGPEQAVRLAGLAARVGAAVNLIPWNPVPGMPWARPAGGRQMDFLAALRARGIAATVRGEKGQEIAAACGQLRLQVERGERGERVVREGRGGHGERGVARGVRAV